MKLLVVRFLKDHFYCPPTDMQEKLLVEIFQFTMNSNSFI